MGTGCGMSREDYNTAPLRDTAYTIAQGKRIKKSYGQGKSIIHANVAEALKMRQVVTNLIVIYVDCILLHLHKCYT